MKNKPVATVSLPVAETSLTVESWPVDRPVPYAANARTLTPRAVDTVAASLAEFGWRQPIVVDVAGVVVAGHTRLLAAKQLGLESVPVHVASGVTPAQIAAYRLMDNRSADESDWNSELLQSELQALQALEFDMALTGFDQAELKAFLKAGDAPGLTGDDDAPELADVAVSIPGDLWLLGSHRLLCGDSTSIDAVKRLLDGEKIDLVFTDPPYGMSYGGGRAAGVRRAQHLKELG